MGFRKIIAGIFVLLIVICELTAQVGTLFKQIGVQDGLSNGSVKSIVQDREGFIWIGTIGGLNRYDGSDFKVYNHSWHDTGGISADDITCILEDAKERLWIGTFGGGLNRYHKETGRFEVFQASNKPDSSISSNEVHTIYETKDGAIWIGTEEGLNKFHEQSQTFGTYAHSAENPYSLSHNSVRAIHEDNQGNLWIGTFGGGLNKYDRQNGVFTHFRIQASDPHSISSDFILDIESLDKENLLLGTNGGGLDVFNKTQKKAGNFFQKYDYHFPDAQIIKDVFIDTKHNIWIGTDGAGLFKIMPSQESEGDASQYKVEQFQYANQIKSSLGSNAVYKIYEDQQHNIWVGTAWSGISIIEHSESNIEYFYSDIYGMDPSPVLSVYVEDQDDLWIGSDGKGLYHYNRQSGIVKNYNSKNTEALGNYIQLIKKDRHDNLWLGTYANGLHYFNTKTGNIRSYQHNSQKPQSIGHNNVRDMLADEEGNYWIATWGGGISYFNTKTGRFENYQHDENHPASISNNNVLDLEEAPNGKIWVGTFGGGLNLFDPDKKTFRKFTHQSDNINSISGNNIICLHKDAGKNLWIGTWGAGLTRFNIIEQEFTRFGIEDGLPNNMITALEEDDKGVLWISTKKGMCYLEPESNKIKMLNQDRDYKVNEFHINSSFKDRDGKLYFGGLKGLIAFNPDRLNSQSRKLNVKLTGIELFNKEVAVGEESPLSKQLGYLNKLELNHKQSVFTLKFAALHYPFSDHCEYSIKMEGFEDEWRDIGTQRSATFTNLSPGEYVFKVRARMHGADWDSEHTELKIEILPPFYKTWWALLIYVSIFIALLVVYQRYTLLWAKLKNNLKLEKVKREQEASLHQLKLCFFTNISHEIRTPLTLILTPLKELIRQGEGGVQVKQKLHTIKKNTDRLLDLINELLDFRKLEMGKMKIHVAEGNIVKFTHEIYLSFSEYAKSRHIAYHFHASQDNIIVWYDRAQLEKVIYNLLSNAFKFTPDHGNIEVRIDTEGQQVRIAVSDSGEGIPEEKLPHVFDRFYQSEGGSIMNESGFGIGLSIAKEIIELHSGIIKASSGEGQGSTFEIMLKQGRQHFTDDQIMHEYKNSEQLEHYQALDLSPAPGMEDVHPDNQPGGQPATDITLLIVEDNHDLREYLRQSLSLHYQVLDAQGGNEGMKLATEKLPDLIISDVMMPDMNGIELCSKLKTDVRTSHIPIILLTARTAMVYKLEGLETGADEYLVKPFSDEELRTRINNLLTNRRMLRERYMKEAMLKPKDIVLNSPDEGFLEKLIQSIESHMEESDYKVESLAREMGMSHAVIYKKVKALTGQSLIEFVRDMRLKRAAQLLMQNKLSVTEICYRVGFTDRRYFSQAFKKKFGDTPSDYARNFSEG